MTPLKHQISLIPFSIEHWYSPYKRRRFDKNLVIANRSRVSCAHNISKASMITSWPWNLGKRSLKVTGNGSIEQIIHDLLLDDLLDVEYYRDLETWVRGHSRSLSAIWKLGCGFLFACYSNYGRICSRLWDIQCKRMTWPWKLGYGRSRSLKTAPFDRPYATFYWWPMVGHCKYNSILCIFALFDVE